MDDAARTVSEETDCPKDDHNDRDCIKEIAHFVKFLLNDVRKKVGSTNRIITSPLSF